jgi:hypothetical protein
MDVSRVIAVIPANAGIHLDLAVRFLFHDQDQNGLQFALE